MTKDEIIKKLQTKKNKEKKTILEVLPELF